MTLHARVARVDDYTGELSQELQKLELECARGTLNPEEQMDFLQDLRAAIHRKDIAPWRRRAVLLSSLGLASGLATRILPLPEEKRRLFETVLMAAGALFLLGSAFCFGVTFRRRRREGAWLAGLEERIRKGGSLFD